MKAQVYSISLPGWAHLDVQKRRGELRYFQYPCLLTPFIYIYIYIYIIIYKAHTNGDENSGTFWDRLDTQRMRWESTPQSPTLALFTSFSGPLLFHVVYVAWCFMMLFDVFWRFLLFLDFLMSFAVYLRLCDIVCCLLTFVMFFDASCCFIMVD